MFTPLNEEHNSEKLKEIEKEKEKIKRIYYLFLLNKKLEDVFSYKLVHEENLNLLDRVKEYALYNHIRSGKRKINLDDVVGYKRPLLEYIETLIRDGLFIKAKKLLNVAKEKRFTCNKYYELLRRIKKEYRFISRL